MKKIFILALILSFTQLGYSQLALTTTQTAEWYVKNVLLGQGIKVSNVKFTGDPLQICSFANGATTNLGLDEGIVLAGGNANVITGPNNSGGSSGSIAYSSYLDPDLQNILNGNTAIYDIAVLEFDFVPTGKNMEFKYVFGSEEYPEYVGGSFNDIFGFFISGPGISGPYSNNGMNIALLPGSGDFVSINNVNINKNSQYYIDNAGGATIQYDAFTTVLTAKATVQPCQQYHIKLAIADVGDHSFDSGVCLKAGSFSSPTTGLEVVYSNATAYQSAVEACSNAYINVDVGYNVQSDTTINYNITGTAKNGIDYTTIPGYITIPKNSHSATIVIDPINDNINESTEYIKLEFTFNDPCLGVQKQYAKVVISDGLKIKTDTQFVQCNETSITPNVNDVGYFNWYADNNTSSKIATSVDNNPSSSILLSQITDVTGTAPNRIFKVYVEKIDSISGYLHDDLSNFTFDSINYLNPNDNEAKLYFNAEEDFNLESIDIQYGIAVDDTTQYVLYIYNSAGTIVGSKTFSPPNYMGIPTVYTVNNINIFIPKGTGYYIGMSLLGGLAVSSWTHSGLNPYPEQCIIDNHLIATIVGPNYPHGTYFPAPYFFNWKINTVSIDAKTCGRFPVVIKEICNLCEKPTSLSFNSPKDTTCLNEALNLNAQYTLNPKPLDKYYYSWYKDGSLISQSTTYSDFQITSTSTTDAGIYTLRIEDGNNNDSQCYLEASIEVAPNIPPIINLGADQTICQPNSYTFDAGSFKDAYVWSTGETTQTITPNATGTYSVTVTEKNCYSSDEVNLTVNPLPIINLGADQTICEPNAYTFDAGTGIDAYAWSTGETTQTIAPKTSGTYSVTVTTKNCSSSDDVNLTVNPLPIINLGSDQTICEPNAYTFDAGTGIDTYTWSTGETTQTITPNATGTYSVTVTEKNCSSSDDVNLTVNPLPIINLGADQTICEPNAYTFDAGTGIDAYAWSTGETTQTITPNATGTYSVTVTEKNCSSSDDVNLTVNPLPIINLGADQTICEPNAYTFDAGTGIDAYAWSTGETTQTIAPKTSGTYSVTVTTKNCSSSDDVNLTVNPLPIINLGADQTICEPNSYTFDAGTGIDAYAWSTGETTQTIAPKATGTYSVTVTTKNCSSSDDVNLTVNPLPIINLGADQTICEPNSYTFDAGTGIDAYAWSTGETTQTIAPKATGTYSVTVTTKNCSSSDDVNLTVNPLPIINLGADQTICEPNAYTFDAGTGIDAYAWSTGETTQTIAPKASGTYSVTVTTKNCSSSDDVNLTVNPLPIINLGSDQTICEPNSYTFDAGTGIDAYAWSTGETTQTIAPKTSGTYSVTVTTKNCSSSDDVNLTVNPLPIINLGSDQTICEPNAYTFDAGTGIDTYTWSTGETTQTIAPKATGTYSVTVTTKNCSSSDDVNLTVNPLPIINLGADQTICEPNAYTFDAGTGIDTYTWSTGETTQTIAPKTSGTYSVTVTTKNCSSSDDVNLTVNPLPIINLGADQTICEPNAYTFDAGTGIDTYTWSTGETTQTIAPKTSGTYSVTVTTKNCSSSDDVNLTVNPLPIINLGADQTICEPNAYTFDAGTGIDTYTWSTGETTQTIAPKTSGTYSVTVTTKNCSSSDDVNLTVNPLPIINLGADQTICEPNAYTFDAGTGIDTYTWSTGETTQTIAPKTSGTYSVTVTTKNCSSSDDVNLTVNPLPIINLGSDQTICEPNAYTFDAGTGIDAYAWSTGETTQTIAPKATGTYSVTVTTKNCSSSDDVNLTVNPLPIINLGSDQTICEPNAYTFDAGTGIDAYAWSTGETTQTIAPKTSGTYSVTVTTKNCSSSDDVNLTVNPLPIINLGADQTICEPNAYTFDAGTGIDAYAWSTGETTQTIAPKTSGTYSVTVTTKNCSSSDDVNLTVNPLPIINLGSDQTICEPNAYTFDAGTGIDAYAWSTGETTQTIAPKTSGTYSVTVTTKNCSSSDDVNLTVNPLPIINLGADQTICEPNAYTFDAGTGIDAYAWSTGETTQTIAPKATGTYSVIVTTKNCSSSDDVNLTVNPLPIINLGSDQTICEPNSYTFDAGTGIDTYTWNTGETTQTIAPNATGNYSVTVTTKGCSSSDNVNLTVVLLPVIDAGIDTTICDGTSFTRTITTESGVQYLWSNGDAGSQSDIAKAGTYTISATNSNGCLSTDNFNVKVVLIPKAPKVWGDTILCYYETQTTLYAKGSNLTWYADNGIVTGDSLQVTVSNNPQLVFHATQTDYKCESPQATITVTQNPKYTGLEIGAADTAFCEYDATDKLFIGHGYFTNNWWTVSGNNVIEKNNITSNVVSVDFVKPGLSVLKLSTIDTDGCYFETTKSIVVTPKPTAGFEYMAGNKQRVYFKNTSDTAWVDGLEHPSPNNYVWSFDLENSKFTPFNGNDTIIQYQYGYHDVQLIAINNAGCKDTITQTIFTDCVRRLYIPTAFSPTNETATELKVFKPKGIGLKAFKIWVYDIWGNLLWYSDKLVNNQPAESWDGNYNGQTMKLDTYIWKVEAVFLDDSEWEGQDGATSKQHCVFGNVILIR